MESLIRHCIVDIETKKVINIVEYKELQTGTPPSLGDNLLCVPSDYGQIGGTFDGVQIINPPAPKPEDLFKNLS